MKKSCHLRGGGGFLTETSSKNLDAILTNPDLQQTLKETVPTQYQETLGNFLNPENGKIVFKAENNPGSARYDGQNGQIIVNSNVLKNTSSDDLMKVLVHEAMNGAQHTAFDTQEEELLCESVALKTRARLVAAGKAADGEIYGVKYSDIASMSDEEVDKFLKERFINGIIPTYWSDHGVEPLDVGGYTNRIKDKTGTITLQDGRGGVVDLKSGSLISIGEDNSYKLGEDVFLEGAGAVAGTTCQMFKVDEQGHLQTIGMISFEELQPIPGSDVAEGNFPEMMIPPQVREHRAQVEQGQTQTGQIQSGDKLYSFRITHFNPNL